MPNLMSSHHHLSHPIESTATSARSNSRTARRAQDTLDKVYDHLDFTHAYEAFVNTIQGVSIHAIRKGLLSVGVKDNEVIVFSELMDAKSLFLTANADTVYAFGVLDLTKGPMVLEVPPRFLGAIDDYWFRWVIDIGLPGADRGEGGKYLILPPGYDGPVPEGGFFTARARTTSSCGSAARSWRTRAIRSRPPKRSASSPRSTRTSPAASAPPSPSSWPARPRSAASRPPPPTVFHEGSGKVMNTVPPNDWSFYEMLNEVVQQEPATSLDPELMGPVAAIGIVKGKPFAPDARMKKILTEALAVANATSRSLFMHPRDPSWFYYPGSAWWNYLFETGYQFETPIPLITREGAKPFPPTGYRTLDARTNFFYGITGITPGMAMRLTGIGSQYLLASLGCEQAVPRRWQDLQGDAAQGHSRRRTSGRSRSTTTRRARCSTRRSAIRAPAARAIRRPPPKRTPTARRRSTSARNSRTGSSGATGSRPCPARAGS